MPSGNAPKSLLGKQLQVRSRLGGHGKTARCCLPEHFLDTPLTKALASTIAAYPENRRRRWGLQEACSFPRLSEGRSLWKGQPHRRNESPQETGQIPQVALCHHHRRRNRFGADQGGTRTCEVVPGWTLD